MIGASQEPVRLGNAQLLHFLLIEWCREREEG
jgi:hypothetical protein